LSNGLTLPRVLEANAQPEESKVEGQGGPMVGPEARQQAVQEDYVVVLTTGPEDGGNAASRALDLAINMLAMDFRVTLFLFLSASRWAFTEGALGIRAPGYDPVADLLEAFVEAGGRVLVCSTCVKTHCFLPGFDDADPNLGSLSRWARQAGLTTLAGMVLDGRIIVV